MDDKHPEIIIIKRHSSHEEEHHGGAWKIAFADFMTAMMAFFLVLWIINATDKNTKTIIARYFNPLKLEDMAKAQKGIRLPVGDEARQTKPINDDTPKKQDEPGPSSGEADKKEPAAKDGGKQDKSDKQDKQDKQSKETVDPAQPKAHLSETALQGDPYTSLDKIAGKVATLESPKVGAAAGSSPTQEPAPLDLDAFVDPFKPVARGAPTDSLVAADPQAPQQSAPPNPDAMRPTRHDACNVHTRRDAKAGLFRADRGTCRSVNSAPALRAARKGISCVEATCSHRSWSWVVSGPPPARPSRCTNHQPRSPRRRSHTRSSHPRSCSRSRWRPWSCNSRRISRRSRPRA